MAVIYAERSFDQYQLDFNRPIRNKDQIRLQQDADIAVEHLYYQDIYAISWSMGLSNYASGLMGHDLSMGGAQRLTGGTVEAYVETVWSTWQYVTGWLIYEIDVPAIEIDSAMRSQGRSDDMRLIDRFLAGNDIFELSYMDDRADGGGGNDKLFGGNGNDTLHGGAGHDLLSGDGGNDHLYLDSGNDILNGGAGWDWVRATGSKAVTLRLSQEVEQQRTGYGLDRLISIENAAGAAGNDRLYGTDGANRLQGRGGDDRLFGLDGRDRLQGGRGNDHLDGGSGNDSLNGSAGDDRLVGGAGRDLMTGGQGADRFVFRQVDDSGKTSARADRIRDFEQGVDVIDLRRIDASDVLEGNNKFRFVGETGIGTLDAGEIALRQVDRAGTKADYTLILLDTDADRRPEAVIRLDGLHDLTANDFLL